MARKRKGGQGKVAEYSGDTFPWRDLGIEYWSGLSYEIAPKGSGKARFRWDEKFLILEEGIISGNPVSTCNRYNICEATFWRWEDRRRDAVLAGAAGNDPYGLLGLVDSSTRPRTIHTVVKSETKRRILYLKDHYPFMGATQIRSQMLWQYKESVAVDTIRKILRRSGRDPYVDNLTRHEKVGSFERPCPRDLYMTDFFEFVFEDQSLHLLAMLDDHSRYIVSHGVFLEKTMDHVIEVLIEAVCKCGKPRQFLSDRGQQFFSTGGKNRFSKVLEAMGIQQINARPHHPQTVGKCERFWQTLLSEFLNVREFVSIEDLKRQLRRWIGWYNKKRAHSAIEGVPPKERFFKKG